MKKTLSIFGVLILISSVVFAGGIDDPSSTKVVVTQNGKIIKVYYKSEFKNVKVSILNEDGAVVFSETVRNKQQGFIRPYNLSQLKEGDYRIQFEDENGVNEKTVSIEKAKPELLSAIVKMRDEKKCAVLLSGKNDATATISIKDQNNKVLQQSDFIADGSSTRLIDLSKFNEPVTVEVKGNDGTLVTKSIE